MSHIVKRLGEAALLARKMAPGVWLPPILSRRQAMMVRKEWMADGKEWPYEHIVPGIPKNDPPYRGGRQKGYKREAVREERRARIEEAMAKMPEMIAEYRASRKVPWEDVSPVDRLLLTRRQTFNKYVARKLK